MVYTPTGRNDLMKKDKESSFRELEPEANPALAERDGHDPGRTGAGFQSGVGVNATMWQNPRAARLIDALLSGKITRIQPHIDLSLQDGFSYPEADGVIGTSGKETILILESISREGLLLKEDFQTILTTPGGSVQLMPVERCPYCDSDKIVRGQLIEHFHCGYIGLEEEFTSGLKQVCPKCRREIKLIGTDYRKPGARYVCNACQEVFPSPVVKCRSLRTGEVYSLEELNRVPLYSYSLNEARRKRLEFEFEPKRQLIDYLQRLGYNVRESVKVMGRSGAAHTIDLLASVVDPITRHDVAIGILAASGNETEVGIDSLFSFDSKIYDTGIDSKMVIAVPGLASEAARFAERQRIRVYSLDELRNLSRRYADSADAGGRESPESESAVTPDLARLGPRGWLRWLLEKKGYRVEEKYQLKGRSGAEHILEFYARKDDGVMDHSIAACVITKDDVRGSDVNTVIKFDSAAYDVGIRDKLIISVPKLSQETRQFASYQRIKILETKDLADFSRKYLNDAARADVPH
jgi:hypothetical protein